MSSIMGDDNVVGREGDQHPPSKTRQGGLSSLTLLDCSTLPDCSVVATVTSAVTRRNTMKASKEDNDRGGRETISSLTTLQSRWQQTRQLDVLGDLQRRGEERRGQKKTITDHGRDKQQRAGSMP